MFLERTEPACKNANPVCITTERHILILDENRKSSVITEDDGRGDDDKRICRISEQTGHGSSSD